MTGCDPGTAIVQRILPAPPDVVYDEWLDSDALTEFIAPYPSRTGRIELDARVGGRFLIEMIDSGTVVHVTGEYLELDRPRRLRFTWASDLGGGFESVVTIDLQPVDDQSTVMTIEHAQLPRNWRADHEQGWTRIAEQLGAKLASATRGQRA